MTNQFQEFIAEVDRSSMPLEKKIAAQALVQRLLDGDRIAEVLKDLAEPLGLTPEMVMQHVIQGDGH